MPKFTLGNIRSAKLSNEQVFEMRNLYAEGATQAHLSRTFGVNINTVGRIVRGESRQGVPLVLDGEDHQAAQARLVELQEKRGQEVLADLTAGAQKVYNKTIKPEKELDRLANHNEGKR